MRELYSEDQLKEAGLQYFKGDLLATNVWIRKYALKSSSPGLFEEGTPDDTIKRLTGEIARIEAKWPNPLAYDEIYDYLKGFEKFIFAGSILFGLGNSRQISSLGNCFFIDNGSDSYGGIFNTDETMVQLMKRRGGVGITIEHLRPASSIVKNAAQTSTGAISFMDRFSNSTREVAQDGRRGALMITCHVHHPDILDFIMKKDDLEKVTGANVSVKVTDEFMQAVESDGDFFLRWPIDIKVEDIHLPYNKLHKREDGTYIKRIKAKELWNIIIRQAHKNAEPGVLFWDNIIKESPADCYQHLGFKTLGTNPCGEVPLSPSDSCRLGSINLSTLSLNPFTPNAKIDWSELAKRARFAQRVMDDIVSLEEEKVLAILAKIDNDPEPESIKRTEKETWLKVLEVLRNGRRTGVGVLGLGDLLASIGVRFGTTEASEIADDIHRVIAINSYKESVTLAKERGPFPIWEGNLEASNPFIRRVITENFSRGEYEEYAKYGRRNIANLSIAPTGSLAILGGTTSGIEPAFKIYYRRRRKINPNEEGVKIHFVDDLGDSWEEYNVLHSGFIRWYSIVEGIPYEEAKIKLESLSEADLDLLVEKSPWNGSESHNIDYVEKVRMQGRIQKWIDHSISVTHNLPEKISIQEVNDIYFQGWHAGCKGVTIYREGSRSGVLLTSKENTDFKETSAPKRPKELEADYYFASAKGLKFAVIVGLLQGKPYEIFAFENPPMSKNTKGKVIKIKKGQYKFVNGDFEIPDIQLAASRVEERTLTLTASMLLRHGAPITHVIKVIRKIDENVTSFSSVVRRYLSRYVEGGEIINGETCPTCVGNNIAIEEGCKHCLDCGWSAC